MKTGNLFMVFKKAPFQAVITLLSFALFLVLYILFTAGCVEPMYLNGLLFAVPFLCFGAVTYFTAKGEIGRQVSTIITVIMAIVFSFVGLYLFFSMAIIAATTQTTDVGKYERALQLTGYPNREITKCFPKMIPENARKVQFSYNPAFGMGGETFELQFETDSGSIENYTDEFTKNAKWSGKADDSIASAKGINASIFYVSGYPKLKGDFTVYLFYSEPLEGWNHGKIGLSAVCKESNEVLFYAEDW